MSDLLSNSENGTSLRSEFLYAHAVSVIRLLFLKYFELPFLPLDLKKGILGHQIILNLNQKT